MSWHPIETAPRDGTWFLVYRKDGGVVVACRHNPSSRTDEILSVPGRYAQVETTHWMPLPPPPQGEDDGR